MLRRYSYAKSRQRETKNPQLAGFIKSSISSLIELIGMINIVSRRCDDDVCSQEAYQYRVHQEE